MKRTLLALLAAASIVTAVALPAWAAFPGSGPKMLYVEDLSPGFDLNAISVRSGATVQIIPSAGSTGAGMTGGISPNGKKITYASNSGSPSDIWVARIDGGNAHQVTAGADQDGYPHFSPDGKKIVFVRNNSDLTIMNADGSNPKVILADEGIIMQPIWSPNGQRIIFSEHAPDPDVSWDILSIRPDGTGVKVLAGRGYNELAGDFSPDGRSIVYCRPYGTGAYAVFRMSSKGTKKAPLIVKSGRDLTAPQYSSDGKLILYQHWNGVTSDIWSARASDGKRRTQLLANGRNNYLVYND